MQLCKPKCTHRQVHVQVSRWQHPAVHWRWEQAAKLLLLVLHGWLLAGSLARKCCLKRGVSQRAAHPYPLVAKRTILCKRGRMLEETRRTRLVDCIGRERGARVHGDLVFRFRLGQWHASERHDVYTQLCWWMVIRQWHTELLSGWRPCRAGCYRALLSAWNWYA